MKIAPKISIAIPVLNESGNIIDCLESVYGQDYPKKKFEVFVVDAGCTDNTINLAKKYPVEIIQNPEKDAQRGKMLAFKRSTGEFYLYLDADVRLRGKDFFQKMLKPLLENKNIVASFSRYYSKESDSWLTRFLTYDPLQRDPIYEFFSVSPENTIKARKDGYFLCEFRKDLIPPEGRLLYRVDVLKKSYIFKRKKFMELDNLTILVSEGKKYFAYVPEAGYYHDFIKDLGTLLKKRVRNIEKNYVYQEEGRYFTWFDFKNPKDVFKILAWILYVHLFFPGLIRGAYKSIKFNDAICLLEPVINLIETDVILFAFAKTFVSWRLGTRTHDF